MDSGLSGTAARKKPPDKRTTEPPKQIELLTYALQEPLPAHYLALTRHFSCTTNPSS